MTTQAETSSEDFNAFPLTATDRQILAMKDEDYHLTEWDELRQIICKDKGYLHLSPCFVF